MKAQTFVQSDKVRESCAEYGTDAVALNEAINVPEKLSRHRGPPVVTMHHQFRNKTAFMRPKEAEFVK
jgi:hypothetical protein